MSVVRLKFDGTVKSEVSLPRGRQSVRVGPNRALRTGGGWRTAVISLNHADLEGSVDRTVRMMKGQQPILDAARKTLKQRR